MGRTDRGGLKSSECMQSGHPLKLGISNSRENQELTLLVLLGGSESGPPDWLGRSGLWWHLYVNSLQSWFTFQRGLVNTYFTDCTGVSCWRLQAGLTYHRLVVSHLTRTGLQDGLVTQQAIV